MQITKAMELVASSKLRKAKSGRRPAGRILRRSMKPCRISRENTDFTSVYAKEAQSPRYCYVLIGGDRGLAGGYNANLFKCLETESAGRDYVVLPIGKKAVEYCSRRKLEILTDAFRGDRRCVGGGLLRNGKCFVQGIPGRQIRSY